jgi:hypothetical protein
MYESQGKVEMVSLISETAEKKATISKAFLPLIATPAFDSIPASMPEPQTV